LEELEEMNRTKSDMVTLAAQLQDAEERMLEARGARSKESKMASLRQAVVRLKQAFLESEEARSANEISSMHGRREVEGEGREASKDEVGDMRIQLSSLIEEMAGSEF
jgi:hypothetical protein